MPAFGLDMSTYVYMPAVASNMMTIDLFGRLVLLGGP